MVMPRQTTYKDRAESPGNTESRTQLQVVQPGNTLHKSFITDGPSQRCRRESTPFVIVARTLDDRFLTYSTQQVYLLSNA